MGFSPHKLDKNELRVKKHYTCLGVLPPAHNTAEPVRSVPCDVNMTIEGRQVFEYLHNKRLRQVENLAESLNASVAWSDSGTDIVLSFTLSQQDDKFKESAKTWHNDIHSVFEEFIHKYEFKAIKIPQDPKEIFPAVQGFVSEKSKQCKTKDVDVAINNDSIDFVGSSNLVDDLSQQFIKVYFKPH